MCCSDEGNGDGRRGIDVRSEVIVDCEQRRRSPGNTTERHGFHTKTGPTTSRPVPEPDSRRSRLTLQQDHSIHLHSASLR
jgi:hypothetical protein